MMKVLEINVLGVNKWLSLVQISFIKFIQDRSETETGLVRKGNYVNSWDSNTKGIETNSNILTDQIRGIWRHSINKIGWDKERGDKFRLFLWKR